MNHADGMPASGVAVTNGTQVTRTGDDGQFELPDEGRFVAITRPTDHTAATWWLPVSTDELRFTIERSVQSLPYEFVHLTDTHMTVPQSGVESEKGGFTLYREGSLPDEIRAFLRSLPEVAPDAQSIFITGDLVDHGLAEEYEAYIEALGASPVPVHLIPGNHDHMNGAHGSFVSRNNYLTNVGTPDLYEHYLGPRWYSFDVAGLHVVTLDWHTHELGLDHEQQNAWLRADLASIPHGSPWILLFHDQPAASIVDEMPWLPIAAFSGHWHTSRVVEVDGTLHVNSPTSFFANLDYSPPAFRHVTWDGEAITLRTQIMPWLPTPASLGDTSTATYAASSTPSMDDAVLWRAELAGAGQRQRVTVDGDMVFAGAQIEDRPAGTVEALDLATGALLWRAHTSSAVKTSPVVAGDVVIAAEVGGDVSGFDRLTGDLLWVTPSTDPLRRFAWGSPTVQGDRVYLGDQSDLRCLDTRTGEVVWRRTDLSPHHNLVNHSAPLVVGDLLVQGFWPTPSHPVGLDARTGETVWASAEMGADDLFAVLKRLLILGTAVFDEATDSVVIPAFGATTSIDRATGLVRWAQEHEGGFSPATPIVTPVGYVVTVTGHGLRMVSAETGETLWDLPIEGDAAFPMAAYTKAAHPVIAPPVLVGDELLLPGLDGVIRRISLDGVVVGQTQLASPIAAALVDAGDRLIAVGTDGNVIALSTEVAR
ncbi:PQQ-binding-like beta-propeller repeat protein [Conyzicola lurida]|uniref:outer membrane protein assembly factor BamB family protein n=1 Tax=Conyzicola lurida TaxID=1172621 RepID=UPI00162280A2